MTETEWMWRMDWCKKKGLSPADSDVWNLAGEEYAKKLGITEGIFQNKRG